MKNRFTICLTVVILLLSLLLPGCSKSAESPAMPSEAKYDMEYEYAVAEDAAYGGDLDGGGYAADTAVSKRKVIYNSDYTLETLDMSATLSALETALSSCGGFVANSDYNGRGNDGQYRYATIVCRVPVSAVGRFKDAVEAAGHVTNKSEYGNDITDSYFDVEARLNALTVQEERLLELLEESGSLSDLLEVERELARVRTEIERLTGTLRMYDDLVDLATFTINVRNVTELTPTEELTFWQKVGDAFSNSWAVARKILNALLFALIYLFPYLIVAGVVLLIILLARRNKKKKAKKTGDIDQIKE